MADGESDPGKLAELIEALRGNPEPIHRQILSLFLARIEGVDQQIQQRDGRIAEALKKHPDQVVRLAEVAGFGVDSAQQVIAEVGPEAQTFESAGHLAAWVGVCPGREESAGVSHNNRLPKGNCYLRRVLAPAAQAAVKKQGSRIQAVFRRLVPRLGYNKAIWAIAPRLCRLVWKILHHRVQFIEHGLITNPKSQKRRVQKMLQALRRLGYKVEVTPPPSLVPEG